MRLHPRRRSGRTVYSRTAQHIVALTTVPKNLTSNYRKLAALGRTPNAIMFHIVLAALFWTINEIVGYVVTGVFPEK